MSVADAGALVTGGASGLGLATARLLADRGAYVVVADLPGSDGKAVAEEIGGRFVPCDVTDADQVAAAVDAASADAPLRSLVHCAGRGGPVRVVERDGTPGSMEEFEAIVRVNLFGTFNVLRLASAKMATNEVRDGDRGAIVLTASVAAWEGQVGQVAYASSKAGIVGMTLVAARDLSRHAIRVATIAPGLFDTPLMARVPEDARLALGKTMPHPQRLGRPEEYADLALAILQNPMLNGETIRLDGGVRMGLR